MCPNWGRHKRAILETVSHLALDGESFLGYGSGRTKLNKRRVGKRAAVSRAFALYPEEARREKESPTSK